MRLLRTADDRFRDLPGFPYPAQYAEVPGGDGQSALRIGYVADGPADDPVVLLLHSEPSWSFLYRSMLPALARAGLRPSRPTCPGSGAPTSPRR
jgi:haloalkane dehalogenase